MNLYTEVGEYIQMEAEGKIKKDFASNRNKNYEARIKSLSQDIAELRTRIKTLESNFDVSAAQYKRQVDIVPDIIHKPEYDSTFFF